MTAPTRSTTPPRRGGPPQRQQQQRTPAEPVSFGEIAKGVGHRIVLYGPGGIGKTTLAATAPGPVAFFDLDESLPRLAGQLDGLDVRPVASGGDWQAIRDALHAPGWDAIKTIVIDSATKAEELAVAWTCANVPHEKGKAITGIENFGFGKGYQHVFDTFLALLGDLDQHVRAGRNVLLVCHECTTNVPNPTGEDWLRWEPRLQSPSSGKASIRLRVKEWADHVLFVGYDVEVEEGKGKGSGTRTVWPVELPHCMAKSRTIAEPMELGYLDGGVWAALLGEATA